jgi:hypothetical protein
MCEYSTIDCYEHMPDTHYKKLVYRLKTAKNDEERNIFAAQLKAFHSIVGSDKAKQYAEDKINDKLLQKYKEEEK